MVSSYQSWLEYEAVWIGGYRRKLMRTTTHVTIPAVLVLMALLLGGLAFVDGMSAAGALMGAVSGLAVGLAVCLPFYLLLRFGLRDSKYRRLVEQAVETAGVTEPEREQLGAELLAARDDPKSRIYFEMKSMNSNSTPARFMVTPHYALLVGGYPYAILVRLGDMAEIRANQEKKLETRRGTQTRAARLLTLYSIGFYRRDRADRGLSPGDLPDEAMGFFSQRVRDDALKLLRQRTGLVRDSAE